MWYATPIGFFSVVEHKRDQKKLLIRARRREDLKRLLEFARPYRTRAPSRRRIYDTPTADYPFRVFMHKTEFAHVMMAMTYNIRYTNFKEHVYRDRDDIVYACLLHDVWWIMAQLEGDKRERLNEVLMMLYAEEEDDE